MAFDINNVLIFLKASNSNSKSLYLRFYKICIKFLSNPTILTKKSYSVSFLILLQKGSIFLERYLLLFLQQRPVCSLNDSDAIQKTYRYFFIISSSFFPVILIDIFSGKQEVIILHLKLMD